MVTTQGDRTHISVILDRTGSMESIRHDTIGGFNRFLSEQQALPNPATLTLVQFDSQDPYEVLHNFTPIGMVPGLTPTSYVPRASTPLFDAIGRGINDLAARLDALPADQRPQQVLFVIVTDGQENASRDFTGAQVKRMIDERRKSGWTFVFLSADEQAIPDGDSLGIQADCSVAFSKTRAGSGDLWKLASTRVLRSRRSEPSDVSLEDIKREIERERREREQR